MASSAGAGAYFGASGGGFTATASIILSETSDFCGDPLTPCPRATFSSSATGTVDDNTPQISSISPSTWNAGQANSVTISGTAFGTNAPALSFSVGGISYTLSSWNDTQIVALITPSANSPAESLTVSVTNNGYGGSGFVSGGNSSTGSGASASVNPISAPVPRILFNGTDVTNTTVSSSVCCVVGQQVPLTTQVNSSVAVTSSLWTIPGTSVAGYVHTSTDGAVQAVNTAAPSVTYYWLSAGNQYQVQYSYCLVNQECNSATATFTVVGPTASIGQPPLGNGQPLLGTVNIGTTAATCNNGALTPPCVVLGGSGANLGVQFQWSFTPPNGYSTQPFWVQVLDDFTWVATLSTGGTQTCHPSTNPGWSPPVLDLRYPATTNNPTNDNPGVALKSIYTEVKPTFQARMYLMWNSGLTNAIDVPLGYVIWVFSADAQWSASSSAWALASSSKSTTSFQATSFPPTWSSVVVPQPASCQ